MKFLFLHDTLPFGDCMGARFSLSSMLRVDLSDIGNERRGKSTKGTWNPLRQTKMGNLG